MRDLRQGGGLRRELTQTVWEGMKKGNVYAIKISQIVMGIVISTKENREI